MYLDRDDKFEMVQTAINLMTDNGQHPHIILNSLVRAYDLPNHQGRNLYAECKLILKGRAEEIPHKLN